MDTPFDQRVPLPSEFRRRRQRDEAQSSLRHMPPVLSILAWVIAIVVVCIAYSSPDSNVTAGFGRVMWPSSRHGIANDLEETRIYMQRLEEKLDTSKTNSTLPSLVGALNQSAVAVSAAASFVSCHDNFVHDIKTWKGSSGTCIPLFQQALDCHNHLVRFHVHHRNVSSICRNNLVSELEHEIDRIDKWEHQRAGATLNEVMSMSAFLEDWKQMFSWQRNRKVVQDEGDYQRGRRAALMKRELGKDIERVQGLRILDEDKYRCRQRLRDRYDRLMALFTSADCQGLDSPCLCASIDFTAIDDLFEQAATEMAQLTYHLPNREP